MFNKNDPLISSVTKVMQENQAIRDAVDAVNEEFGIAGKRDLPHQFHAEYDALVEELAKEALVGNQHKLDVNKNNRLDKQDFKALRSMKKKPMEEQEVNTAAKSDSLNATKTAPQSTITLKPLKKPGLPVLGGMTVAKKNMEEAMSALAGTTGAQTASGSTGAGGSIGGAGSAMTAKPKKLAPSSSTPTSVMGKPMTEEEIEEASLSAKAARAGKDIGKKGKMFAKIAASAAKRYGSEERGKKVAGAILKKMRAKAGMEEQKLDEFIANNPYAPKPEVKTIQQMNADRVQAGIKAVTDKMPPAQATQAKDFANQVTAIAKPEAAKAGVDINPAVGMKRTPAAPPSGADAAKDAAVARLRQQRTDVRTGGAPGAAANAARPAPSPAAPKPVAPKPKVIQGPDGTTATMTGRGNDAIVRNKSGTYAGSVVKGLGGGAKIQNFRAGGGGPVVGKKD